MAEPVLHIQSGKDIFPIGSVVQTGHGTVRIVGKKVFSDYVVYSVEQAERKVLTPYAAPAPFPYLRRAWSWLRDLLHSA